MAFALVSSTSKQQTASPLVSSAINTTGANLICVCNSTYAGGTVLSDSLGNTWSTVSSRKYVGFVALDSQYCLNPTVGASHTFTSAGSNYCFQVVAAFSGAAASSALDQTNSASASGVTSQAPGSITPTENNELVVSYLAIDGGSNNPSIGSSYTMVASTYNNAISEGGGLGYIIQTTAGATNASWSWSGSCAAVVVVGSFKAAASTPTGNVFWPAPMDGLGSGGPFFRGSSA